DRKQDQRVLHWRPPVCVTRRRTGARPGADGSIARNAASGQGQSYPGRRPRKATGNRAWGTTRGPGTGQGERVDLAGGGCYFTSASFLRPLPGEARHMPVICCLVLLSWAAPGPDYAQLQEMLHDRQDPLGQGRAARLLVQSSAAEADRLVREGLKHVEN